jgi:hypothetical protein
MVDTHAGGRNANSDIQRHLTWSRRCRVLHLDAILTCSGSGRRGSDIFRTICSGARPNEKAHRGSHVGRVTSVKSLPAGFALPTGVFAKPQGGVELAPEADVAATSLELTPLDWIRGLLNRCRAVLLDPTQTPTAFDSTQLIIFQLPSVCRSST